jgi:hypothetical protein
MKAAINRMIPGGSISTVLEEEGGPKLSELEHRF